MKKLLLSFTLLASLATAQTITKKAVINITDAGNPPGVGYFLERAPGACGANASQSFVRLNTTPSVNKILTDETVNFGTFCFRVIATFDGQESEPSNLLQLAFKPMKVTISGDAVIEVK